MTSSSGMARSWRSQQQPLGELFEGLPHALTKEERFGKFVADNPDFVEWFCRRALQDRAAGLRRGSAKLYFEEYRGKHINGDGRYRLNNDFTSLMARLAVERHSILNGFFETRGMWDPTRKVPRK